MGLGNFISSQIKLDLQGGWLINFDPKYKKHQFHLINCLEYEDKFILITKENLNSIQYLVDSSRLNQLFKWFNEYE